MGVVKYEEVLSERDLLRLNVHADGMVTSRDNAVKELVNLVQKIIEVKYKPNYATKQDLLRCLAKADVAIEQMIITTDEEQISSYRKTIYDNYRKRHLGADIAILEEETLN